MRFSVVLAALVGFSAASPFMMAEGNSVDDIVARDPNNANPNKRKGRIVNAVDIVGRDPNNANPDKRKGRIVNAVDIVGRDSEDDGKY